MKIMRTVNKEKYEETMTTLKRSQISPYSDAQSYEGTLLFQKGKYFLRTKGREIPFTGNDCFLLDLENDNASQPHKDIMKRYGSKKLTVTGTIIKGELYPYGTQVDGKAYYTYSSIDNGLELLARKTARTKKRVEEAFSQFAEKAKKAEITQGLPPSSFQKLAERMISKK
jgi:hypothetical protein